MQTKTTGDAKNDKRPSPAPVKDNPVAAKGWKVEEHAAKAVVSDGKTHEVVYEYTGCGNGGEMFRRYNEDDDNYSGVMASRMRRDDWA